MPLTLFAWGRCLSLGLSPDQHRGLRRVWRRYVRELTSERPVVLIHVV